MSNSCQKHIRLQGGLSRPINLIFSHGSLEKQKDLVSLIEDVKVRKQCVHRNVRVPYGQGRPKILYNYSEALLESRIGLYLALRILRT
jgi:hypothetical protein